MYNQHTIVGHVGHDPDIQTTQKGVRVANITVATNDKWTDKQGIKRERVEWHRVAVFGPLVDSFIVRYVKQGDLIFVQGSSYTQTLRDNQGKERESKNITVGATGVFRLLKSKIGRRYEDELILDEGEAPTMPLNPDIPF